MSNEKQSPSEIWNSMMESFHGGEHLEAGMKVHYDPTHGDKENGIIKSINPQSEIAFVVYNCNNDWDNYQHYTGCATNISDLKLGWV